MYGTSSFHGPKSTGVGWRVAVITDIVRDRSRNDSPGPPNVPNMEGAFLSPYRSSHVSLLGANASDPRLLFGSSGMEAYFLSTRIQNRKCYTFHALFDELTKPILPEKEDTKRSIT